MADQLTTVSKLRFISKAGIISQSEMEAIGKIIKIQLSLSELEKFVRQVVAMRAQRIAPGLSAEESQCRRLL